MLGAKIRAFALVPLLSLDSSSILFAEIFLQKKIYTAVSRHVSNGLYAVFV